MNRISAEIFPKVPTAGETVYPKAPISVRSYSWNVRGGPATAQLEMVGDPLDTWDALDWLRGPVILRREDGTPVWWGYVEEAEVGVGAINVGARIDSMANRLAVAYTENTGAGSSRGTTAWVQDDTSVGYFGTKELLLSQADLNAGAADAFRNAQLAVRKLPQSTIRPGRGSKLTARLNCRGWYATIDWRYFSRAQGRYAYIPSPGVSTTSFPFGIPAVTDPDPTKAKPAVVKVAQQFWNTTWGWTVSTVKLQIRKVGTPTEGVRLSLWSNHPTNGVPLTEITSAVIADSAIGGYGGDWVTFTWGTPWAVDAANVYWLVLERNGGSPNKDNYYTVQGASVVETPPSYPIAYNGTTWASFAGTLAFIQEGTEETSTQMGNMITTGGQFINGYYVTDENMVIPVGSGVFSNPFRNGDTTALTELESLLDVGNSAGIRYLATVDVNRYIAVYPEPQLTDYYRQFAIDAGGGVSDGFGKSVDPATCPVGMWVSLQDVLPKTTSVTSLAIPPAFFVESAVYNAQTDTLELTPRGAAGIEDIGRIRQG